MHPICFGYRRSLGILPSPDDFGLPRHAAAHAADSTSACSSTVGGAGLLDRGPRARLVEPWTPDNSRPEILSKTLTCQPDSASAPREIDLEALFQEVLGD
jgi:hypothetical protein